MAGPSQVSPPAPLRLPTQQTRECTGASLSRGRAATPSTSQCQVVQDRACLCLQHNGLFLQWKELWYRYSLFQMMLWSWRALHFLWQREIKWHFAVPTGRKTFVNPHLILMLPSTEMVFSLVLSLQEKWSFHPCPRLTKATTSVNTQRKESHRRAGWQWQVTWCSDSFIDESHTAYIFVQFVGCMGCAVYHHQMLPQLAGVPLNAYMLYVYESMCCCLFLFIYLFIECRMDRVQSKFP